MISVHPRTSTTFTANGIAVLDTEVIAPVVTEELGGAFKLVFSYPADGPAAQHLTLEAIVACPVPGMKQRQGFRIHEVTTSLDGLLEVTCFHVFYDLSANLIADTFVVNKTAKAALDQILAAANTKHSFTATSADSVTVASARLVRMPVAQALMDTGEDNSFASRWGGELVRDNWHIHHTPARGQDRGVVIRDRKNLTGYESTLDYTTVTTRVLPVGYDGLLLPELYVDSPKLDTYVTPRIRVIRYGQVKAIKDPDKPREDELPLGKAHAELRRLARLEFTQNHVDEPTASYRVSFADLASTREYADFAELETVELGDTVTVRHADLGVALSARVVAYDYNPLTGSYVSVELGSVAAKFTSVTRQIKQTQQTVEEAVATAGFALSSADGKNTNHYGPTQPEHARLGDTWFKTNGETTEIWIYTTTSAGEAGWVALATDLNHAHVAAELETTRREVAQISTDIDKAQKAVEETRKQVAVLDERVDATVVAARDAHNQAVTALEAAELLIGAGDNLLVNGQMATRQFWHPALSWAGSGGPNNEPSVVTKPGQGTLTAYQGPPLDLRAGDWFDFSVWLKADKPGSKIYIELRDEAGAHAATNTTLIGTSTSPGKYLLASQELTTAWQQFRIRGQVTATASGHVALGAWYFNHPNGSEKTATISICQAVMRRLSTEAVTALDNAAKAQRRAEEAFHLAASKMDKGEVEQIVKTSANGLNQITLATTSPNKPGKASGDTWWKHAGGQLVGQWIWNGTTWQATQLAHSVIGSVDVHSLQVTGTARVSQAVVEKLFADSAHFGVLAAHRIVVGDGTNLWPDQDLTMTYSGWTRTPEGTITRTGTGQEEGEYYPWTQITARVGEKYVGGFEIDRSDAAQHVSLRAQWRAQSTGTWHDLGPVALASSFPVSIAQTITVPSGADALRFGLFLEAHITPGVRVQVRHIQIRRQTSAVLIEDGAVTANKIAANAITAKHVAARSITSDKLTIANGFIQTAMIKDAAITSAKIASLDAAKITTGTLNANRIGARSITADKLAANAIQVGLAGWTNSIRISPYSIEWWNDKTLQGRIDSSGMHFYYGTTYLGWMGQAGMKNKPDNVRGLNTHLADGASYAAWTTGAGSDQHYVVFTLDPKGKIWPGEHGIHLGADLWLDGNSLRTRGKRSISITDTQLGNRGTFAGLRGPNWLAQVVFQTNDLYLVTNGTRYNLTREMTRLQRVTSAVNTLIGYFNQGWIKTIRDTGGGNITWEYFNNTGLGTINIPND